MKRQMRKGPLFAAILLVCANTFAHARYSSKTSQAAQTPPQQSLAHDHHDGLDVSADPYTDGERAKKKFGKADPIPAGILPVEVFLRNELDQPIKIDLSTVQLEVRPPEGQRQDIDSLPPVDVARLIAHPEGAGAGSAPRLPHIGLPDFGDKKTESMADILRPLSLDADVVPPSGSIHGFLYFNMNHQMSLVRNASLYVPDATLIPSKTALMFFEVSLAGAGER
jgi:hypothetical protein